MAVEEPNRLAPRTSTLRALFAKSCNQCAFPECEHELVDQEDDYVAEV